MSLSGMAGNSRNSGYMRAANDWYVEPEWAIEALMNAECFHGTVLDPACGAGTIPKLFLKCRLPAIGSDIEDRGFGARCDFLSDVYPVSAVPNIVTNPPFALADQFVRKSLGIATSKVAVLQRLAWLESKRRASLFDETPLARVWIFRRRVSMPPGGSGLKATGGSIPFAWYVWDKKWRGAPVIGWLE